MIDPKAGAESRRPAVTLLCHKLTQFVNLIVWIRIHFAMTLSVRLIIRSLKLRIINSLCFLLAFSRFNICSIRLCT